ncbi:MAG: DUF1127 domain-containing protein [Pseudooceanicola sp.]|nr:DUF1127 domain-containing protein [Pseudooceanicola sp.]
MAEQIAEGIGRFAANFAAQRRYRQTVDALSGLGDRELADIGLSRAEIRDVALATAYRG